MKIDEPLVLDGNLSKKVWAEVPFTSDFVDISTPTLPRLRTRVKMRWNESFLFVAAELEEPELWATIREHNEVIFHDNDFEIFVDPNGTTWHYKEYEMNAFNSTWDLMLPRPYGDGGGEKSCRVDPAPCFDMQPPLASAVALDGSINEPSGTPDVGWSVEVALPIKELMHLNADPADGKTPKAGVFWRINFSRVQWALQVQDGAYVKTPSCQSCAQPGDDKEDNWVWSPQGVVAMHQPETWGMVQFSERGAPLQSYDEWPARALARALYDAEHAYVAQEDGKSDSKAYTDDFAALDQLATPPGVLSACAVNPQIQLGPNGTSFSASLGSVAGPAELRAQVTDLRYTTVARATPGERQYV